MEIDHIIPPLTCKHKLYYTIFVEFGLSNASVHSLYDLNIRQTFYRGAGPLNKVYSPTNLCYTLIIKLVAQCLASATEIII